MFEPHGQNLFVIENPMLLLLLFLIDIAELWPSCVEWAIALKALHLALSQD